MLFPCHDTDCWQRCDAIQVSGLPSCIINPLVLCSLPAVMDNCPHNCLRAVVL